MIDDILFEDEVFLQEIPLPSLGGEITGFSMDGSFFNFESEPVVITNKETVSISIS